MTGQTIPVVTRILLLIKTIQPDPSNPKYYARRRWFFSKNCWEKPISLSKCRTSHGLAGQFWLLESALKSAIRSKIKGSSRCVDLQLRKLSSDFERSSPLALFFFHIHACIIQRCLFALSFHWHIWVLDCVFVYTWYCKMATMSFNIIIITIYKKYF